MANTIKLKRSTTADAAPGSLASGEIAANVNTGTRSARIYLGRSDGTVVAALMQADVDDTPVDGVTTRPISSNWAYDHVAAADPHTGYRLESADVDLADGKAIDITDTTPGTDHTFTGLKATMTAGESLVFGDAVYMKSDGKVWKADASAATTAPCIGIALATASANDAVEVGMIGVARDDTWAWTVGGKIYLSETTGALTQTAPSTASSVTQSVGIAIHADYVLFLPSLNLLVHS